MGYQKMIIVGNATKDAGVRQSEGKAAYADFRVAVNRTEEQKTLCPLRVFGKLVDKCDRVKKGLKVLAEGQVDISEYTDKEGQKRITFRILADTHRLLWEQKGGAEKPPLCLFLGGSRDYGAALQSYYYISLLVPFFDIPVSLGDLLQGIASIDDRFHLTRLNKLSEEN